MKSRLLIVILITGACGTDAASSSASVERDSAGVRIVEHAGIPATPLRLEPEPLVRIGAVDGDEAYQLHNVQGVVRLADGRIAVAHANHELRFFDSAGVHLGTVGREGGGPGEFRRIAQLRRIGGDSLLVYDAAARRITIIAPDMTAARNTPLELAGERIPTLAAVAADGTLLIRRALSAMPPPGAADVTRDTLQFAVAGDSIMPLRTYPGPEMKISITESGGQISSVNIFQIPFTSAPHATAAGTQFVTASGDAWELHVWDRDGRLVRIVRSAHVTSRPVTADVVREYVEREVQRRSERPGFDEAATRRQLEGTPHSATVPLLTALVGANDGTVWVREWSADDSERWVVVAADGRIRGTIELPPSFRPFSITGDVVYGVERDELDVESVRAYRIEE